MPAMKIALCNEVLRERPLDAQCAYAAQLGYDGIELAPFTLGPDPHLLPTAERARVRRIAADAGVPIVALHWLLVTPEGLSITATDPATRRRTVDIMRRLVALASDLGAAVMVHGSPAQRRITDGDEPPVAWERARECFAAIAADAEAAGITYCIEPLARTETAFINTVEEAVKLVDAIGSPAIRTMIDASAAHRTEADSIPALLDRWLPSGYVRHVQVNDRNRRGPGQGEDSFAEMFAVLLRHDYRGIVSVEPFVYEPDGPATAARAIGYLRGLLEALAR